MIGQTIAHYEILEQIGTGGMGAVYRALDKKLRRDVAIKVLPAELASNPERLERFKREALAVASLNHPNIVTIFSVEESGAQSFIVMELIQGRALNAMIPKGGFQVERFLEIAIALAEALEAAHEKGITHRDLKPGNVMIEDSGRVKVIDFGLAKLAPFSDPNGTDPLSQLPTVAVTLEGRVLGTPSYMSPEQVDGKLVDHRSDIFSLGILFHEMLTNQQPFKGESNMSIMSSILKDSAESVSELRPEIPTEISRLVQRCLYKNPSERFQTILNVRNELRDIQRDLLTGSITSLRNTAPKRSAGPKPAIATTAAILMIVVSFAAYLLRPGNSKKHTPSAPASNASRSTPVGPPLPITYETGAEEWPSWSWDDTHIVYSAPGEADVRDLYLRSSSRSEPAQRLTTTDTDEFQPVLSPDSSTVYFVRLEQAGNRKEMTDAIYGIFMTGSGEKVGIWKRNLTTGEEKQLVHGAFHPTISKSGRLAYEMPYSINELYPRIWISNADGRNAFVVSREKELQNVLHLEPTWSPDEKWIAFQRRGGGFGKAKIYVVNVDTQEMHPVTGEDDMYEIDPAWSGSGRYIYYSGQRHGAINIWRVALDENAKPLGPPEPVTSGGGNDIQGAGAHLSDRLVYAQQKYNSDIWSLPVNPVTGKATGEPKLLVKTDREDSRGVIAKHHQWIAFNSNRDGSMNIWIQDLDTGRSWPLTRGPKDGEIGGDYQPNWSPDDRSLVFFSFRSGSGDIYRIELDDAGQPAGDPSQPRQLTTHSSNNLNPFFSPDGTRIVYMSDRSGLYETFLINPDGSNERRLSDQRTGGHFLPWIRGGVLQSSVIDDKRFWVALHEDRPPVAIAPITAKVGGHTSFNPTETIAIDLESHKTMKVIDLGTGATESLFEFPDKGTRIDYPVWSPDGTRVTFDRADPEGGDLWLLE